MDWLVFAGGVGLGAIVALFLLYFFILRPLLDMVFAVFLRAFFRTVFPTRR
jgi:hypothetical protein